MYDTGGLIAALAANVSADQKLRDAVLASPNSTTEHIKARLLADKHVVLGGQQQDAAGGRGSVLGGRASAARASVLGAGRASAIGRASAAGTSRGSVLGRASILGRGRASALANQPLVDIQGAPFDFVICACAGSTNATGGDLSSITCSDLFASSGKPSDGGEAGFGNLVDVPSVHLVGIEDGLKTQSEAIASVSCLCDALSSLYSLLGRILGTTFERGLGTVPPVHHRLVLTAPTFSPGSQP